MVVLHQLGVLVLLAGVTFAMADAGPGCGSKCGSHPCKDEVDIDATVPPIGTATWTVTVCRSGHCDTAKLTAQTTSAVAGTTNISIDTSGSKPKLVIVGRPDGNSRTDTWSVDVADAKGKTIVSGQKTLDYGDYTHTDCSCATGAFSLN